MFTDDEDDVSSVNAVRFGVMPSLVSLQQMRNRLHLAYLGKKLMKWTAISTGKELRRLAVDINEIYHNFGEDIRNAFILLARARYFFPDLNKMTLSDIQKEANVRLNSNMKALAGVKVFQYVAVENKKPYAHLGISEGGQSIQEAKDAWLELLKRMIIMVQLRVNFVLVDSVHKNANKKKNVLTKVLIPRILATIHYILTELEEREREETFRLKRIKQKKIREKEIKSKGDRKSDKEDDGKNDRKDNGKDDGKNYEILKYNSYTTIINEDKIDIKKDVKYDEKDDNKKDNKMDERKYDKSDDKIHICCCCETIIAENETTKDIKLSITPHEPISEFKSEVVPHKNISSEEEVKNLISIIANVMKSAELIKLENLMTANLDRLLNTCNDIKNKLDDYANAPLCAVCKRNMLDHITKTNAELLKIPIQTNATRLVSSESNSTKPTYQHTCNLVSSKNPSIKPSGSQLNKSSTEKYHMCRISLPDKNANTNEALLMTLSQTPTTSFVPSTSDSRKRACQDACVPTHSATPSSGQELNNINTVRYHMCNKNLQDDNVTMTVKPLKIQSPSPINKLVPTEPDSSINPTCHGTFDFVSSLTPSIKSPINHTQSKSNSIKYHMCQKNLRDKVTLNKISQTRIIRPSVDDFIKPCKGLCNSAPPPSPSIKLVSKESIEVIEQPVATYEFNPENDIQFGYFEKKYKETVKVKRLQNEDGTISEEKQTIIIKTEKRNRLKKDDCVPGSSAYDSGSEYYGDCGCGGRSVHGTRNDYNDNGTPVYCCLRRTRSERIHKKNKMGDPKVRLCMSAENQKRATCKESMTGCDNDKSCCMLMEASRVNIALEPKRIPYIYSLSNDSCICSSTKIDSVHGTGFSLGSGNSVIRGTGKVSRSSVQCETKSIGTEAVWKDVCTSTIDIVIIPSKVMINIKSTGPVSHNSKLNYSVSFNSMKNEVDERKDNGCNFKVSSKKAKPNYSNDCEGSCNEVILKGSLLNALKEIYLPQTRTKFSHEAANSTRKEKQFYNLSSKFLSNEMPQKLVKTSVEAICAICRTKSDETEKSSCFKAWSPMPYTCISYPSNDSWKLRQINPKSSVTLSSSSCCATCQLSQLEFELSSSRDEESAKLSYGSCQSIGAVTCDKIYKEFPEICCKNSSEKAIVTTGYPQKHSCCIANDSKRSSNKINKQSVERQKKEDKYKKVSVKTPVSSTKTQKHFEMKYCKSRNSEYSNDEKQDFIDTTRLTKAKQVLKCPRKPEVQTKDIGTSTNRSSRFDVRPAKLHLVDKIRGNCPYQSDTQIIRNKFIAWLPIKPVQKCKSSYVGNDYPFRQ